eukprot:10695837-Prorocentrum_lima.AAC.1
MTTLLAHVREDLQKQWHNVERGRLPSSTQTEVLYADATARDLLEATSRTNKRISASYGLR